jgi:hypothetical protein
MFKGLSPPRSTAGSAKTSAINATQLLGNGAFYGLLAQLLVVLAGTKTMKMGILLNIARTAGKRGVNNTSHTSNTGVISSQKVAVNHALLACHRQFSKRNDGFFGGLVLGAVGG